MLSASNRKSFLAGFKMAIETRPAKGFEGVAILVQGKIVGKDKVIEYADKLSDSQVKGIIQSKPEDLK